MKTLCWSSLLFLLLAVTGRSQDMQARFPGEAGAGGLLPENQEVRRQLAELIFAPIGSEAQVLPGAAAGRIFTQRLANHRVKVRVEAVQDFRYTLFLNERSAAASGTRSPGDPFPVAGAGAWIIKRDASDGRFLQAKVYLRDDPGCFVRLFPDGKRTTLDAFLFDVPVARRVGVPLEFESVLVETFEKVMRLTAATVPWERFLARGDPDADRDTRRFAQEIRRRLPDLGDREDGALDGSGRYVYIESGLPQEGAGGLNCSGFAKWVTDGFVYPLTGKYLEIGPLTEKHLETRGNRWSLRFEDARDPYFGLDWSRNLALTLLRAAGYPAPGPEICDVRTDEYVRYTEDVGYPMEELALVLYLDRVRNPGSLYLGSVNREYGTRPVLRQHFHLLVLVPYFSEEGGFRVDVFDRARESSLQEIRRSFAGDFVHLVRLSPGDRFEPPRPLE
jgi:hypothetical protein